MSSQESSTAQQPQQRHSSSSTGRLKKRRHRQPDRLGWLGDASFESSRPHSAPTSQHHDAFGSQSSQDITPHPMEWTPPDDGKTNGDMVDLTVDSDDNKNKKSNQWQCAQCTLLNSIKETKCAVCGCRKSSIRLKSDDPKTNGIQSNGIHKQSKRNTKAPSNKQESQLWKWTQSQSSQTKSTTKKLTSKKSSRPSTKSTELWIHKHKPTTTTDLCLAPKKIDEVRKFLTSHVEARTFRRNGVPKSIYDTQLSQLLILVGSPGIGKSTMIEVLCQEMKLAVLKWNDDYLRNNEDSVQHVSQLASFEEFLVGAGTGLDSIVCDGVKRGVGSVIVIEEVSNCILFFYLFMS